jgi:hypothetical protein
MADFIYTRRSIVHAHRRIFASELEDLRAYARLTTDLMRVETTKHQAHIEKTISALDEDEREAYFDNNLDTFELLATRFPNQQYQSLVVLTYTVAETRLIFVSKSLLWASATRLTLSDLAGSSPFQKARKVISQIAGLAIDPQLWDEVDAYRRIRNCIVHNAGVLESEPHQLVKRLLTKRPLEIRYSDIEGLVIQPALVFSFAAACEALFGAICDRWAVAKTISAHPEPIL